ncbi:MAG TPA: hypothetical protein VJ850_06540 [Candidatus Limnocylindrales bacterium]|nr:hypothetical protein [Candidatus Limnocylindrales bacterium]
MKRLPDPSFDQRIADWLEDDPVLAPRQVLDTVLAAQPSISQRRARRQPWRFSSMTPLARLTAAAAMSVVLVGTAIAITRLGPSVGTIPSTQPSPPTSAELSTAPPTTATSPTPDPDRVQELQIAAGEILGKQTYLFDGSYTAVVYANNPTQNQQCSVVVVARVGDSLSNDVFLLATSLAPGSTMRSSQPEPVEFPRGDYRIVLDTEQFFALDPTFGTIPPDEIRECTDWSIALTAR